MRILIAGDLSLQNRAARCRWDDQQTDKSFSGVRRIVSECDSAIVNLESPITDCVRPLLKDGPSLKNSTFALNILKNCGFSAVTLANNHLKDYGSQGVTDTIKACNENGILTFGAGEDLADARRPMILEKDGLKIGILNVCEHESSIATDSTAGAAPLELANLFYDIRTLRMEVDKVIVIIHGGCEHYQLPTPRMKRDYHLIADFGADVIVNHHQHCYSGFETYNSVPIFYGLGNFFFDNPKKRHDKWNEGLLLELEITKDEIRFELIPYNQCDDDPVIMIRGYEEVKDKIEEMNAIIADDNLLNEQFDRLVASKKPLYPFLPYGNHYLRALYNRGFLPDCMSVHRKVKIENAINCETHREVLQKYFENSLDKQQ